MTALIIVTLFMGICLGLIVFWIKTILDVADSTFKDKTFKYLWIIGIFCFPVVGVISWYLFGKETTWQDNKYDYVG